jgi:ribosomal protein S18 acetylase RimI-like enzyme
VLTVRAATVDDADVLAGLIAEFNGPQGHANATAARLAACEGMEIALIAFAGAEAVGFTCLRVTPAIGTQTPHALLTELYVQEGHRRHGYGEALVAHAERLALERGATYLYLFTGQQNLTAQAFYERHGYEVAGVTYRRPLAPPLSRTGDDVGGGPERACEPKDGRAAQRAGGEGRSYPNRFDE